MKNRITTCSLLRLIAVAALVIYAVQAEPASAVEIARPSNSGKPGAAATITGDAMAGAKIFAANCMPCHGGEGKGGIPNPGSADGAVPPLNPIDKTMVSKDPKVFAYNIDLFIQHGSTPDGSNPAIKMPAWGSDNMLKQQQLADVIAYIISLNTR